MGFVALTDASLVSGTLANLELLSISGNSVGEVGMRSMVNALSKGALPSIRDLRMQNNPGMDEVLHAAAEQAMEQRAGRLSYGAREAHELRLHTFERQNPADAAAAALDTVGHVMHPDLRGRLTEMSGRLSETSGRHSETSGRLSSASVEEVSA